MEKKMIAFLQPHVPKYRKDFFEAVNKQLETEIYCYENIEIAKSNNFESANIPTLSIFTLEHKGFLVYNLFTFLKNKYEVLILMLHFGHLSTWTLLLTKKFHRKKIILWGQGISVKRYSKEEIQPSLLLKWMIYLSDGIWFYTDKELAQWKKIFPKKKMISLNNTISDIKFILEHTGHLNKAELKVKYKIYQEKCFIFCARFTNPHRRVDLLLSIINSLDTEKFAFIIIGDGHFKPDFSNYKNVFNYGAVYDLELKNELFDIADIYFQPGWVGLSIVEAMAYGKPVFTFKRSEDILQSVEYNYIENGVNGYIFDSLNSLTNTVNLISETEIKELGENAKNYVKEVLTMNNMVTSAVNLIKEVKE